LLIHFYNNNSTFTIFFDLVIIFYLIIYPFIEEKLNYLFFENKK
jgi:hypothetical protein